jgi:hypothetical protein
MTNNYKTVDLKKRMHGSSVPRQEKPIEKKSAEKKSRNSEEIDKIFNDADEEKYNNRISRPQPRKIDDNIYGKILVTIVLLAMLGGGYIFLKKDTAGGEAVSGEAKWYAVELVNGEVYYGQITDKSADPVELNKVYYNYDQEKKEGESPSANLRLVKRGKEAHGPSGSMSIVRSQVILFEELKKDSKVLKAILDNEK